MCQFEFDFGLVQRCRVGPLRVNNIVNYVTQ